jgi:transcription elongation factor Elf1
MKLPTFPCPECEVEIISFCLLHPSGFVFWIAICENCNMAMSSIAIYSAIQMFSAPVAMGRLMATYEN